MRHLTVSMLAYALLAGTAVADNSPTALTSNTAEQQPNATIDLTGGPSPPASAMCGVTDI